jgi:general secretion pathway protein A
MYLEHYGLQEPPFSITPDPRFVYLSERHRDALAHLLFGITQGGGGGFVQLTGEVGTGKTTLSRLLLEQLPDDTRVALVLNPRQSATELLETVCEELRLDLEGARGSAKALVDRLNGYLLSAYGDGLRVVLVIDEAQNLPVDALEQVRLLTNLETDTQKLLQIILIGQPELRDMLARPDLRQLAQRITARFHLTPLDARETADYLRHRYRVAGGQRFPFTARALARIHLRSGGVPRLTNVISERALLAGYARDAQSIDERLVETAAREALPPPPRRAAFRSGWAWAWGGAALAGALALLAFTMQQPLPAPPVPAAPAHAQGAAATPLPPAVADDSAAAEATMDIAPTVHAEVAVLDREPFIDAVAAAADAPLAAWAELLQRWQLPDTAADAAAAAGCAAVLAPGVYCSRGRAGLDRLAATGRPALLRLRSAGREAWALLLGLDALRARLWLDGGIVDVGRLDLQSQWNGDYAALWRGDAELAALLASTRPAFDSTNAEPWLQERLAPRFLDAAAAGATITLAERSDAVKRFQRANGLADDGVVGPETLLVLAAGLPGPRLLEELD